jgi:hypothetical protein
VLRATLAASVEAVEQELILQIGGPAVRVLLSVVVSVSLATADANTKNTRVCV